MANIHCTITNLEGQGIMRLTLSARLIMCQSREGNYGLLLQNKNGSKCFKMTCC